MKATNMAVNKVSRLPLRQILLSVMTAVLLLAGIALLPSGQAHAGGVDKATLPAGYSTANYNIYKALDISNWQGEISKAQFQKLKNQKGITHVIVRVGYTRWAAFLRFADASYKQNIDNAYAAGLKVGAYYYSQAKSESEARKEAKKTVKLLANYKNKITLPVAFDWEWGGRLNASWAKSNGKAGNTRICQAFCEEIKDAGYEPMIYASASVFTGYLNRETLHDKYKIWVAHYTGGKATNYSLPMYMWQFSSTAQFGQSLTNTTNVDINYVFVKKLGQWIAYADGKYKYKQDGIFLKSEWLTLGDNTYYLDADGYRVTGYQQIGNYFYGFDSTGIMYKKTKAQIDGKTYKFLADGKAVLSKAKVVNVSDGQLAYRTKAKLNKGETVGYYSLGQKIKIIRVKGDWVQASNGYWSLATENGIDYLETTKTFPLE